MINIHKQANIQQTPPNNKADLTKCSGTDTNLLLQTYPSSEGITAARFLWYGHSLTQCLSFQLTLFAVLYLYVYVRTRL